MGKFSRIHREQVWQSPPLWVKGVRGLKWPWRNPQVVETLDNSTIYTLTSEWDPPRNYGGTVEDVLRVISLLIVRPMVRKDMLKSKGTTVWEYRPTMYGYYGLTNLSHIGVG